MSKDAMTDEAIRSEVAARVCAYTNDGAHWRIYVSDGQVDIVGEPDSSGTTCALLAMTRTVPGVTGIRIYCGQSASTR